MSSVHSSQEVVLGVAESLILLSIAHCAVRAARARAPHPRAAEAEDAETRAGGLQARHPRHRGHRGEGAAVLLAHVDIALEFVYYIHYYYSKHTYLLTIIITLQP